MSDDSSDEVPVVTRRVLLRLDELGWYEGEASYNANDFSRRTGIGYATANDLLAGRTQRPDVTTLERLADTLRVSVDWLLGRDSDFDVRAYEQGRDYVATLVGDALEKSLSAPSASVDRAARGRKAIDESKKTHVTLVRRKKRG